MRPSNPPASHRISARLLTAVVFAATIGHMPAPAAILYVATCGDDSWTGAKPDCSAPDGPKANIQSAIDAASDGDEIIVAAGTYYEVVSLNGKAINLHSSDGPSATIIDGAGLNSSVVTCTQGEGIETILDGFTVTHGVGTYVGDSSNGYGGGMYIRDSAPNVRNCIFIRNAVTSGIRRRGGGMYSFNSAAVVTNCTFSENRLGTEGYESGGAGMCNESSRTMVRDCTFTKNIVGTGTGGGMENIDSKSIVTNCIFADNVVYLSAGAGMHCAGGAPIVTSCVFVRNKLDTGGHGGGFAGDELATLTNSVLWDNAPDQLSGAVVVAYCDAQNGWSGKGIISKDPQFVDSTNRDFHLHDGSPCIDAGTNGALQWGSDPDGHCRVQDGNDDGVAIIDMGVYEAPGAVADCNGNGVCDSLETDRDCNGNFLPDECDLADGTSPDCNSNGRPDECDIAGGTSPDCNSNEIPDECDIASGKSQDNRPPGGDGIPDECQSVCNATQGTYFNQIQPALRSANDGDEIIVSAGTYYEAIDFKGKAVYLHSADGPTQTIIDVKYESVSGVTCANGESSAATLSGFTVTHGQGTVKNNEGWPSYFGGGLYVYAASPTIDNCIFSENGVDNGWSSEPTNSFGGAVYCYLSNSVMTGCTFDKNFIYGAKIGCYGGAVCSATSNLTFTDCKFTANSAIQIEDPGYGGAIYSYNSATTIERCVFDDNSSSLVGGGIYNEISALTLTDCEFRDNGASNRGEYGGGGALCDVDSSTAIVRCFFGGNASCAGGAISQRGGQISVTDCAFEGNSGSCDFSGSGGAANLDGDSSVVTDSTFDGNTVGYDCYHAHSGGGLFIAGGTVLRCGFKSNAAGCGGSGGGLSSANDTAIINCVFTDNSAAQGGGVSCTGQPIIAGCMLVGNHSKNGAGIHNRGNPLVINCTFSRNEGHAIENTAGRPTLINSILWDDESPELHGGDFTVNYSDIAGGFGGMGNINTDPLFTRNPDPGPDGNWGTGDDDDGDLRLQSNSPCIDAGDPNYTAAPSETDLAGLYRIWDGNADGVATIDMGAYEFASHPYGDLNCDGAVDFNDIDAFVAAIADPDEYAQLYPSCSILLADTNADGAVDFNDIDPFVDCLINNGCP